MLISEAMHAKKIVLFAATSRGTAVLRTMLEPGSIPPVAVVSFNEIFTQESNYATIEAICSANGIFFREWKQVRARVREFLECLHASTAIAIGWRYLIDPNDLRSLEFPLIVFHDSLLPKYRGFAPTATAILCGDETIGMSIIFASEGIDSGDVILQRSTRIGDDTYIAEALDLQTKLYASATKELIELIASGNIRATPQDERLAVYSVWRNPEDAKIAWTESAVAIHRKIRASGYPYPGAFTTLDGAKIFIEKAELVPDLSFAIREPGKFWKLEAGMPIVVCGKGLLKILSALDESKKPLIFRHLRKRFG